MRERKVRRVQSGARARVVQRIAIGLVAAWQVTGHGLLHARTSEAAEVAAAQGGSQLLRPRGPANPTAGWIEFCTNNAAECSVNRDEAELVHLTPETWRTVVAVNVWVNATVKARTDQDHWGVEDRWDYPQDGYGDCEDFQLLKRKLLTERGIPRRAMRMTVVRDELGAGHAVMMVRTLQGEYILDNRTDRVLPWASTGYTFIKREGSEGEKWVWLGARSSPTATATR